MVRGDNGGFQSRLVKPRGGGWFVAGSSERLFSCKKWSLPNACQRRKRLWSSCLGCPLHFHSLGRPWCQRRPSHKEATMKLKWEPVDSLATIWGTAESFISPLPPTPTVAPFPPSLCKDPRKWLINASTFLCFALGGKKNSYMVKDYTFLVLNERALIDLYLSLLLHL